MRPLTWHAALFALILSLCSAAFLSPAQAAPPAASPIGPSQSCQTDCGGGSSPYSCSETDGYNPSVAGTLWYFYYGDLIATYNDYCATSTRLVEYWCNSASTWTTTNFYCTYGCSGGRCL